MSSKFILTGSPQSVQNEYGFPQRGQAAFCGEAAGMAKKRVQRSGDAGCAQVGESGTQHRGNGPARDLLAGPCLAGLPRVKFLLQIRKASNDLVREAKGSRPANTNHER
jgi:hypothetical protein